MWRYPLRKIALVLFVCIWAQLARNLRQYLPEHFTSDLESGLEVHPPIVPTFHALAPAKLDVGMMKGWCLLPSSVPGTILFLNSLCFSVFCSCIFRSQKSSLATRILNIHTAKTRDPMAGVIPLIDRAYPIVYPKLSTFFLWALKTLLKLLFSRSWN